MFYPEGAAVTGTLTARPARLRGRVSAIAGDPLLRSAYSLMLNVVLTSGLGVAFWVVAARIFPSEVVGRDSALVSAMVTVYTLCSLNLSAAMIRFLPVVRRDPKRTVLAAYGVTAAATGIGALVFALVAPRVAREFDFLHHRPGLALLYIVAAAAWGIFTLQDAVLTALRRAPWVPAENALFGVLKIVALPLLFVAHTSHAVFIAWVIPMVLLVIPVNYLIFWRVMPSRTIRPGEVSPVERFGRRGLARFMAQDYLGTIFFQAASTALPIVVVALLGSSKGAYFYMPFMVVSAFDLMFLNVTSSLTVEAAVDESRTPLLVRSVVRRFGPLLLAGVTLFTAGAGLLLLPFGGEYASQGAPVLRLLAISSVARAVVALYAAICRVEGHAARIALMQGGTLVLILTATVGLSHVAGLEGVGFAWLIANGVVASTAAPKVIRVLRAGSTRGGAALHPPLGG
jgi:O-antigen/teichoic acid export membrane protein